MKRKPLLVFICLALWVWSMLGCINGKKVARWNDEHKKQAALYCSKNFPPAYGDTTKKITTDSGGYKQQVEDLQLTVTALNDINDSLIFKLMADTNCSKYAAALKFYQQLLQSVESRIKDFKPVNTYNNFYIPVRDSAEAVAYRLENEDLRKEAAANEKKILQLQGKASVRLWMFIASCVLNLLLVILLFKKKTIF